MSTNPSPAGGAPPSPIDLALQGGGSHGAFTWGVLDRLLEEDVAGSRGDLRHVGGRDECRGDGRRPWPRAGEPRRARRSRISGGGSREAARFQPLPARAARRAARPLDARQFAAIFVAMDLDGAAVLAL